MPGAAVLDIAIFLLDAGAEIAAKTKSWGHDVDAIYFAGSAKNLELFRLLLEHGADLDRAVADGKPLLNHLICWGQIPQTIWLLANGASPNVPDECGWTAVHQAASRGNARIMQAVLDAGGDRLRRDRYKQTPVEVARSKKRVKLVEMMAQ